MPVITKQVSLWPTQKRFCDSTATYRGFCAGIGSGKSKVGAWDLIKRGKPGRLYMVVAPTYTQLRDSSLRSFRDWADHLEIVQTFRWTPKPEAMLKTGAEILFRSADDPDSLRGPNLSGMWLDEASLMHEDAYMVSIGRLRQEGEQGWLSATFTPKGKLHWTYKVFGTPRDDTECFFASTRENPFLPKNFYDSLRTQYSQHQAEQELEGHFMDFGSGNFNPRAWPTYEQTGGGYVIGPLGYRENILHSDMQVIIGFDLATSELKTSDFTAFVVAGLTRDGRLLILDVVNVRLPKEKFGITLDLLCEQYRPTVVACDDDNMSKLMLLEWRRWPHIPEVRCMPILGRAKIVRATPAIIHGENRRIVLPSYAPWRDDFCDQLQAFTGQKSGNKNEAVEHDDMVDALGLVCSVANGLKESQARPTEMPIVLVPGRGVW